MNNITPYSRYVAQVARIAKEDDEKQKKAEERKTKEAAEAEVAKKRGRFFDGTVTKPVERPAASEEPKVSTESQKPKPEETKAAEATKDDKGGEPDAAAKALEAFQEKLPLEKDCLEKMKAMSNGDWAAFSPLPGLCKDCA